VHIPRRTSTILPAALRTLTEGEREILSCLFERDFTEHDPGYGSSLWEGISAWVGAFVLHLPKSIHPTRALGYRRCAIEGAATPALSCSLSSAGTYAYIWPSAMHVVVRFHTVKLSCEQGHEGSGTASTLWNVVAS
jgi:hypothetical protein